MAHVFPKLLVLLIVLSLAGSSSAGAPAAIEGLVTADGSPLAGVSIALQGPVAKRTTTDAQGKFAFPGLPAGLYKLTAQAPGFALLRRTVAVAEGKTLKLNLALVRPAAKPTEEKSDALAKAESKPKLVAAEPMADAAAAPPPAKPTSVRPRGGVDLLSGGKGRSSGAMGSGRVRYNSRRRPSRVAAGPMAGEVASTTNTEQYKDHGVRQWKDASEDKLSTFAVDVDTASYTIARRKLNEGQLPPPASVRTEEFVNYFQYDYAPPKDGPFAVHLEAGPSPFEKKLHLLRVGLRGMDAVGKKRKPAHLTFLVDTSGSMNRTDKIGLVKRSLRFLVDQLKPGDTVALCTYAGSVREVLAPTGMNQRAKIHRAIEDLMAGGSTAMSSGLELAYKLAYKNFKGKSINRVIVLSDGDANVGRTAHGDMLKSIKHYADEGVTLSTIGVGMGNYKDHRMEQLANKGNGNYYYIDTFSAAKRVFGKNLMGTLQVIAQDVKIQVEFDPKYVRKYRLIGYENRHIADRDFRNDKVDAGEIGAGHTVTALYELELTDPKAAFATVRVRWKKPQGVKAAERAFPFRANMMKPSFAATSANTRRAVAAAALAENLRNSPFRESWTMAKAKRIAQEALSRESKEELELIQLIDKAAALMGVK